MGAEPAADFRFAHWPQVRRGALVAYFVALIAWSAAYGVPVQRELVIAWVCGALACHSIGRHPREILQIVIDWLPIVLVLCAYDLTRGAADSLGIGVHVHPMIDFDRTLFFGEAPTEWLQARLYEPGVVNWWDVAFTLVYTSYFIVPFALAGILWVRDRLAFLRFTKRLVSLALAGVATYIVFPAAPPWMAAEMGLLDEVHRTTAEGWRVLGVGPPGSSRRGRPAPTWSPPCPPCTPLSSPWWRCSSGAGWAPALRLLLLLYPLAMGFTLMATGEHYFFDVLLGWVYAGAVMIGWAWWERRRAQQAQAVPADAEPETA